MNTESMKSRENLAKAALFPLGLTTEKQDPVLLGEFTSIGRNVSCDLHIQSNFVSQRHARIEKRNSKWIIRDLQSKNGTFLNGAKIIEAELSRDDEVTFGDICFKFAIPKKVTLELASRNKNWNQQLQLLPAFANTQFSVLMTGPSGAGKDVLARWIHQHSKNSSGPFISINCSALSENLFESELFGHVKGSFTGATSDRKGAFESAQGGTLFLDEIGDLPLHLQPKLLRALENKEIKPVGSDSIKTIDTRVLAATHRDIEKLVANGQFRQDLFFRLNICRVNLPKLIERIEDFESLLYSFAKKYRVRFSHRAINQLLQHPWPGNIRELKNTVARAAAYFPGIEITENHLHMLIDKQVRTSTGLNFKQHEERGQPLIKSIERDLIVERLLHHNGNQRKVADDLSIPKSTLHDRIKSYGINIRELVGVKTKNVTSLREGS